MNYGWDSFCSLHPSKTQKICCVAHSVISVFQGLKEEKNEYGYTR